MKTMHTKRDRSAIGGNDVRVDGEYIVGRKCKPSPLYKLSGSYQKKTDKLIFAAKGVPDVKCNSSTGASAMKWK